LKLNELRERFKQSPSVTLKAEINKFKNKIKDVRDYLTVENMRKRLELEREKLGYKKERMAMKLQEKVQDWQQDGLAMET
jgi:ribosome-binding protein aMBF1 (putative translation factor)